MLCGKFAKSCLIHIWLLLFHLLFSPLESLKFNIHIFTLSCKKRAIKNPFNCENKTMISGVKIVIWIKILPWKNDKFFCMCSKLQLSYMIPKHAMQTFEMFSLYLYTVLISFNPYQHYKYGYFESVFIFCYTRFLLQSQ